MAFLQGGRWANLHALPWMPLREMFNATRSPEVHTSHRAAATFYAQSWALVHYIALAGGNDTKTINLMIAYTDRGLSADESIRPAFGGDFPAFEERVKKYARSRKMSYMQYQAPSLPDLRDRITALDEKRGITELAMFGLRTRRHDDGDVRRLAAAGEAAKLYSRAWQANPGNFEAVNSMAMAYYHHREDRQQTESELRSAISRHPKSTVLRMHLARLQAGNSNLLESKQIWRAC